VHNKINSFSALLLVLAGFVLQLTLLDHIRISGAKPDIMLSLVVFFALFLGPYAGLQAGLISGLLKDIFSAGIFGAHTLTLALTGLVVGALSAKLFKESRLTQVSLVFVSAVLSMTGLYLISSVTSDIMHVNIYEYLLGLIIPTAFYTSFVSALIYPLLIGRYRLKEDREYL
jgi:rod shape-determining protein MreD